MYGLSKDKYYKNSPYTTADSCQIINQIINNITFKVEIIINYGKIIKSNIKLQLNLNKGRN